MKTSTIQDLIKKIRAVMDENITTSTLLPSTETDTLSMDDLIEARILPSIRIIEMNASGIYLSGAKKIDPSTITTDSSGKGTMSLPTDFLRLTAVKLSSWKTFPLIISDSDPLYLQQSSGVPGIRGSVDRPVAVVVTSGSQCELELYPAESKDVATYGHYIPDPSSAASDSVTYCEKLEDAIVYYAAYMTSCVYKNNDSVVFLRDTAFQSAGISSQSHRPSQ